MSHKTKSSRFESSANFVEEQKPCVFEQTLRNIWDAVSVINASLIIVLVMSLQQVPEHKEEPYSYILSDS